MVCCRQFHLVDGDAAALKLQRLLDADAPVFVVSAEHAGNEVDVILAESRASERRRTPPLSRASGGPPIQLEDLVVEVSTPRLRRVTPRERMAASFGSVRVPVSHSNVPSSAWSHGAIAFSRLTSPPS